MAGTLARSQHDMKLTAFIFAVLASASAVTGADFFPPRTFSRDTEYDAVKRQTYSKHLLGMQASSLFAATTNTGLHCYRFTCLRSFHEPFLIEVSIGEDGKGNVVAKMTGVKGGDAPGQFVYNKTNAIDAAAVTNILKVLQENRFWSQSSMSPESGLDGSEWIVEGVLKGRYHVINRWSPLKGSPIWDIGRFLLKQSSMTVTELY
jgi:hypothetical protein